MNKQSNPSSDIRSAPPEADKMYPSSCLISRLHCYIHDYLLKKGFNQSATAFLHEAQIKEASVPVDTPHGFLQEWWSLFWDIFNARFSQASNKDAFNYLEVIQMKQDLERKQRLLQQQMLIHQQYQKSASHQSPPMYHSNGNDDFEEDAKSTSSHVPLNAGKSPIQPPSPRSKEESRKDLNINSVPYNANQGMYYTINPPNSSLHPNNAGSFIMRPALPANQNSQFMQMPRNPQTMQPKAGHIPINAGVYSARNVAPLQQQHAPLQSASNLQKSKRPRKSNSPIPQSVSSKTIMESQSESSQPGEWINAENEIDMFLREHDRDSFSVATNAEFDAHLPHFINPIAVLNGHTNKVSSCSLSKSGNLLASAGHDKKILLWKMEDLKLSAALESHTNQITQVKFCPFEARDNLLVSCSFDKTIRLWTLDENLSFSMDILLGHGSPVLSVDFSSESVLCSCDADGTLKVWNLIDKTCIFSHSIDSSLKQLSIFETTVLLASATTFHMFDLNEMKVVSSIPTNQSKNIVCVDFNSDCSLAVLATIDTLSLLDSKDFRCIQTYTVPGDKISSVCFFKMTISATESLEMVAFGTYKKIYVWNFSSKSRNPVSSLECHEGLVSSICASGTEGLLSSTSHDNLVKLWRINPHFL